MQQWRRPAGEKSRFVTDAVPEKRGGSRIILGGCAPPPRRHDAGAKPGSNRLGKCSKTDDDQTVREGQHAAAVGRGLEPAGNMPVASGRKENQPRPAGLCLQNTSIPHIGLWACGCETATASAKLLRCEYRIDRNEIPFFGNKENFVMRPEKVPQNRAAKACFLCQNGAAGHPKNGLNT